MRLQKWLPNKPCANLKQFSTPFHFGAARLRRPRPSAKLFEVNRWAVHLVEILK